ncbi:MAG: SDR family NAD(P)-dependent oxidoreductase [Streptosporangiales bacterium]
MVDTTPLNERVVLLTGATGDIGACYLRAFTAAGASVVATDVPATAEQGARLVDTVNARGPGRAAFAPCDVTDQESVDAAVETCHSEFGALHSVVNNAAIYGALGEKKPLTELTIDEWDLVLRVNVRGSWQVIKAAVPALSASGDGRIVNVASAVSRNGAPGFAHYVASKAAIEGLTRAAARELGKDGITVNAVSPGLVDDAATRSINNEQYLATVSSTRAIPRAMVPEDLVGAVLWLSGPESGFITGQVLVVDGGGVFV